MKNNSAPFNLLRGKLFTITDRLDGIANQKWAQYRIDAFQIKYSKNEFLEDEHSNVTQVVQVKEEPRGGRKLQNSI
ncbi:hypothetical protein EYC80_004915 [Monilinia laxa]|uniref:Uncharacterized protein n=1 Tax=Monilinia laxa TaxID=61186 RepID=A0A5N6KIH2_MONLA|nr:hypothetical protein EYC80_004915 [Monilinia laxa]